MMYIDQLNDSDTVHVSDLEVVNNDLCQRLNQTAWNIEKRPHCCRSETLSEYLKCCCRRQERLQVV